MLKNEMDLISHYHHRLRLVLNVCLYTKLCGNLITGLIDEQFVTPSSHVRYFLLVSARLLYKITRKTPAAAAWVWAHWAAGCAAAVSEGKSGLMINGLPPLGSVRVRPSKVASIAIAMQVFLGR